jgi:hypothetical protein
MGYLPIYRYPLRWSDSLVRPGDCGRPPALALPPSLIGRLRAQMEKRPVDLGSRDSTLVFAVLLLGIVAISASVLIVILVVTGATSVR